MTLPLTALTPEQLASLAAQNPGAARAAVLHAIERGLRRSHARGELGQSLRPALRSIVRALIDARVSQEPIAEDARADETRATGARWNAQGEREGAAPEGQTRTRDVLDTLDMQINAVHHALESAPRGDSDADADVEGALLNRLASLEERYADELSRRFNGRRPFDPDAAARSMRKADALLVKYAGAASDDPAGE